MDHRIRTSYHPTEPATATLVLSQDGYIRLSFCELQSVPLVHLVSGLDDDEPPAPFGGAMPTVIAGYTEWVSTERPAITLGWDWQLKAIPGGVRLHKIGDPRSNLMLQNDSHTDIGHEKTAAQLEAFIDTMNWQETVHCHIQDRYSG